MRDQENGLTQRIVGLAQSTWLIPVLLLVEVAETTFVPLPYEAIFIALCLAARKRIWLFLAITVLGSAIAGAIMYQLGANLLDPITDRFQLQAALADIEAQFIERGSTLIFLGGLTPVPSYLVNMTAGASAYPFWSFLGLFTASRFIRFAILALLLYFFGERITQAWEASPKWLRWGLTVILLVGVTYWFIRDLV